MVFCCVLLRAAAALIRLCVCERRVARAVADDKAARRYYVSGAVQGVGYRYFAQRTAERLGVAGYAKNLRDGRVEVYAVGPAHSLDVLRADLERGPRSSRVSGVREEQAGIDSRFADAFSIEYDE